MRFVKRLVVRSINAWVDHAPDDSTYAARHRIANRRWRLPYQLSFDERLGCFIVESDGVTYAISRRSRLHYVRRGVSRRRETLLKEYMIREVGLERDDIIVDVGANIGEVSMLAADLYGAIPIAFEPERREFVALQHNLESRRGKAYEALLWSHADEVYFHSANDTGDSSIFDVAEAASVSARRTTTLDAALDSSEFSDRPIKLLKLEAEGAEPEILLGSPSTLARTTFVSADLGPERGREQESTLIPVLSILRDAGFAPISFHHARSTMLFRKGS